MRPEGLPAPLRLKKRRDFLRAQGKGAKHHVRHFLVFVMPRRTDPALDALSGPSPTRLGITVTKKVGKAHVRNRIKRLVREVFRRQRRELPASMDVVFVAKRNAGGMSYDDMQDDFRQLVRRLGGGRYDGAVDEVAHAKRGST